jgi:hypothetical protein
MRRRTSRAARRSQLRPANRAIEPVESRCGEGRQARYFQLHEREELRSHRDHNDEDGKIDRWEYYGQDQKVLKVGTSRAGNGSPDTWAFQSGDGGLDRIELSTRGDGRISRTEFYERGALARAEEDTNGDARIDKWETDRAGALVRVSFDRLHTGTATDTIEYER